MFAGVVVGANGLYAGGASEPDAAGWDASGPSGNFQSGTNSESDLTRRELGSTLILPSNIVRISCDVCHMRTRTCSSPATPLSLLDRIEIGRRRVDVRLLRRFLDIFHGFG